MRFAMFLILAGALGAPLAHAASPAAVPAACPALLNHTLPRLQDDAPQSLCQYRGKVLLVVNTASYCGFTEQYKGLQAMSARYQDQGLVVLGFPSNDFQQEKGSSKEIADFCQGAFGVKFPMFAPSSVRGEKANPFFKSLAAAGATQPRWNFYKYLIGRDGKLIDSYSSLVDPDSRSMRKAVEAALKQP